jgi:hypothetical protein
MKWILTLLGFVILAPLMPIVMVCVFIVWGFAAYLLYLLWSSAGEMLVWCLHCLGYRPQSGGRIR